MIYNGIFNRLSTTMGGKGTETGSTHLGGWDSFLQTVIGEGNLLSKRN